MYSNLNNYYLHIQMLEIINMILYVGIILTTSIVTYILTKTFLYTLIGFLISILIGYIIYAIIQLKADQHKLLIDMYLKINRKKAE